jgi:dihydroorotate dehydrogenase electron transfer subunit
VDAHTEVDDVLLKDRPRVLVAACDGYIEPAIKFAHGVHRSTSTNWQQLVVLGGDTFPFRARPSTILVSGMPAGVIASVPALEEWGIASRLASSADLPGCYDGEVAELAALWLKSLASAIRAELQVVTIGPVPGMQAAAAESNVVLHSVTTTPTLRPR